MSVATTQPVLIAGGWRAADSSSSFQATNPNTNQQRKTEFPVSSWNDCNTALDAAVDAARQLRQISPLKIADYLEDFANRIDDRITELIDIAFIETGLAKSPRLHDVELPRTSNQLRLAAAACRVGSWAQATIDTVAGIRSCYEPIGPVCVFGPNNFPFAFGSLSGGDFAAAIAAGNPVIGKANSSHPETTRLFGEIALQATQSTGLPPATVQLIYRTNHADGERLVADSRIGATGYTGSRSAGLKLKAAADRAGKPIYLELSSVNPVVIMPGALAERPQEIVDEFVASALMGTGQFCTNPGLVVLEKSPESDAFIDVVVETFSATAAGTLLSPAVNKSLTASIAKLQQFGAELLTGGESQKADVVLNRTHFCGPTVSRS